VVIGELDEDLGTAAAERLQQQGYRRPSHGTRCSAGRVVQRAGRTVCDGRKFASGRWLGAVGQLKRGRFSAGGRW
jgi:hypothetical protein